MPTKMFPSTCYKVSSVDTTNTWNWSGLKLVSAVIPSASLEKMRQACTIYTDQKWYSSDAVVGIDGLKASDSHRRDIGCQPLWGKAVELFAARLHMVKPLRAALFKHSQSFWWKIKPSQMLSPIPKEQLLLDVDWRSGQSLTSAGCVFWVSSGETLKPEVFPQA